MDTAFMNSTNCKKSDPQRLLLCHSNKETVSKRAIQMSRSN